MKSIKKIYRIGYGPSSSHTMGPRKAAEQFLQKNLNADAFEITLFGSLAATGKGHYTDKTIIEVLQPKQVKIIWKPDELLPLHPNGMLFKAFTKNQCVDEEEIYSVGGGALKRKNSEPEPEKSIYSKNNMNEIISYCEHAGISLWEFVMQNEDDDIIDYLEEIWQIMCEAIERGINAQGVLSGGLGVSRKAWLFNRKAKMRIPELKDGILVSSFSLAVAEENASGGKIVTAPTCGAAGVLPGVLKYLKNRLLCDDNSILNALATAGLIGNLIKYNASISGAEVGCQGEIGTACAMAAGGAVQLLGGTVKQIEYAAEMGLEHYLGLTCDPVNGLVQIPCIERNAFAARRALDCADFSLMSGGYHRISFDEVVNAMKQTGHDLPSLYRETSFGGLAAVYNKREGKI